MEIERKFLLADGPPSRDLGQGVHIRQGYLAQDGAVAVRIRITETGASLTIKAGSGLARTEVEVRISDAEAEALWPHTVGRIDKTRFRVALGDTPGHVAEVDVFAGDLDGLCVVEVEFDSESSAAAFAVPAWFGRELTGDPAWTNVALARDGRPD